MNILVIIILVAINLPLLLGLGWLFFGTIQSFGQTLLDTLQSIISPFVFSDEEHAGIFQPLKLAMFLFTCAAFAYIQYLLLTWLGLAK
jgi:hypothetical protein